jgi:isoleucyl-tRNA synthetase
MVLPALEDRRKDKVIGTSLAARVHLKATGSLATLLAAHRGILPMLFIVSDVSLTATDADGSDGLSVTVERAGGTKCERCWRYVDVVRAEPEWAGLCERCVDALAEPVH